MPTAQTIASFFNPASKRVAKAPVARDSDYSGASEDDADSDGDYSEEAEPVPTKRVAKRSREECARKSAVLEGVTHTRASLASLSHDELLDVAETLAARVRVLEASLVSPSTFPAKTSPPPFSAETAEAAQATVQAQLAKVCAVALKGIKAQMKWKQSCKAGTAKWSYEGLCSPAVAAALLKDYLKPKELREILDVSQRKAVAKKIDVQAFYTLFGASTYGVSVSIRYGSLSITGSTVMMRFDNVSGELKVSGTYGV